MLHYGAIQWLYNSSWQLSTSAAEKSLSRADVLRSEQLNQVLNQMIIQNIPKEKLEDPKLIALQEASLAQASLHFHSNSDELTSHEHGDVSAESAEALHSFSGLKAGEDSSSFLTEAGENSGGHDGGAGNGFFGVRSMVELVHSEIVGVGHQFGHASSLNNGDITDTLRTLGINGQSKAGHNANENNFTMRVEYAEKSDGDGYIFKIELVPKKQAVFRRISQNVTFLIDRSQTTNSERFEISKWAVAEALTLLRQGDTFNIALFDDRVVRLSTGNIEWNEDSVLQAYDFLSQQQRGDAPLASDFYALLGDILPDFVDDREVNTAILISGSDVISNGEMQQRAISQWTHHNSGKVSLYSIASGQESNMSALDLLSAINKGSLHYTSYDDEVPHLMVNLMQSLQNPIGKDMSATVIANDGMTEISLFPSSTRMPNLYERTPLVLYGTASDLEDFQIVFQGKYSDRWLDVKRQVSFRHAKQVTDHSLEKMWAIQHAYDAYEKYLRTGEGTYLLEAQQILTKYKMPLPF